MTPKKHFAALLLASGLLASLGTKAQYVYSEETRNEVKMNLFSLAAKTFSVQYERDLRPHMTAALGLRFSPYSALPFRNSFTSSGTVSNGDVVNEAVAALEMRNFAITPEVRYYFRRDGSSRGFYGALFGRYSNNGIQSSFRTESSTSATGFRQVGIKGSYGATSVGLMLGAKFMFSEKVSLDWWIAGPMYSAGTLKVDVALEESLSQSDQDQVQRDVNQGASIGPIKAESGTVAFRNNGLTIKAPITLVELRTGLAIGFRF